MFQKPLERRLGIMKLMLQSALMLIIRVMGCH